MASRAGTDLNRYLGHRITIETTLNQFYVGILVGFDEFMNCTMNELQLLDDEKKPTGDIYPKGVVRGRAVISIESEDRVDRR